VASADLIGQLRQFDTPTVVNSIDLFKVRRPDEGHMFHEIACLFPELGVRVAHVVTMLYRSDSPPEPDYSLDFAQYLASIESQPAPRIMVAQDLAERPQAVMFGEMNSALLCALKCDAVVTNGGVRDMDACRAYGFQAFGSFIHTSVGYGHIIDYGCPVTVGGLTVHPGDLLHGDPHGVALVPANIAEYVPEACRAFQDVEAGALGVSRGTDFSATAYVKARDTLRQKMGKLSKRFSQIGCEQAASA